MPASASASASSPPRPNRYGIAALQPDDVQSLAAERHEELVDLFLGDPVAGDAQGIVRRLVHELWRDKAVVHDRVTGAEPLEAANGDQPRVAGAGADEGDGHPRRPATRAWK